MQAEGIKLSITLSSVFVILQTELDVGYPEVGPLISATIQILVRQGHEMVSTNPGLVHSVPFSSRIGNGTTSVCSIQLSRSHYKFGHVIVDLFSTLPIPHRWGALRHIGISCYLSHLGKVELVTGIKPSIKKSKLLKKK